MTENLHWEYGANHSVKYGFIFKAAIPSVYRCRKVFKDELALLVHKPKKKSYHGIVSWVENFR
jgi:hypothetical protein